MAKKKANTETIPSTQDGDLGKLLKKSRESVGYSTAQTAEAMCLAEDILIKLENEDFKSLPEPPYIRGYLRNYAKLAEIEADEIIACYESLRGAAPSDLNYHFKSSAKIHSHQSKKRLSPVLMQLLLLAVLLGSLTALSMIPVVNQWVQKTWESFSNQTTTQSIGATDNPLLTGTMPVPTPLPKPAEIILPKNITEVIPNTTEKATLPSNNDITKTENINSNDSNKNVGGSSKKSNESIDTIKVGEEVKSEALIPASTDGSIKVKLIFNKEVWMRIKDGKKKTVFEGQNTTGQEKELTLKKPLTFRVGNAHGLSLFVDGKPIDISGYIKGSVANFTLE